MDTSNGTLYFRRLKSQDRRLGRNVLHDSRSRMFPVKAEKPKQLESTRHNINIVRLDQGNTGSCTGNAGTHALASDKHWAAGQTVLKPEDANANEGYAVQLYSAATILDPWPGQYPPDDTGSDGLSIVKVLQQRGLISGYQHAFSLDAALTALSQGVVMIGSAWLDGMYNPARDGRISVTGAEVGGHEYILDEIDVQRQIVWMMNSWGKKWGLDGRAYMSWADLAKLLANDGDCTVPVPNSQPAPTPVPVPDPPGQTDAALLAAALARFTPTKGCPAYIRKPAVTWIKSTTKGKSK